MAIWLDLLITLTLAFHLIAMNIASAGPLLCPFFECMARRSPPLSQIGIWAAKASITSFLIGMTLGLGLAGLIWLRGESAFFDVLPRFAYKIKWGVAELVFYLFCMLIYIGLWRRTIAGNRGLRITHRILAVLAATNLLYHFPALFRVMTLAGERVSASEQLSPDIPDIIRAAEFRMLSFTPEVMSISVHFLFASLAVVGALLMWRIGGQQISDHENRESISMLDSARVSVATWGARIALVATLFQLVIGIWVTVSLPIVARNRLLGNDLVSTFSLAAGVILTIALIQMLTPVALGEVTPRAIRRSVIVLVLIIVLMTHTLRHSSPARIHIGGANEFRVTLVGHSKSGHLGD